MSTPAAAMARYMDLLVRAAYDAGFSASGEGWNGEWPDALTDPHYLAIKEIEIERILETIPTGAPTPATFLPGAEHA